MINETGVVVMDLAQWLSLQMRDRNLTFREASEETDIPKSVLSDIVNKNFKPGLGTLARLSERFDMPLWQLIEMCGYKSGVSKSLDQQASRIANLLRAKPELEFVLDRLALLPPEQADGVLRYLEAVIP